MGSAVSPIRIGNLGQAHWCPTCKQHVAWTHVRAHFTLNPTHALVPVNYDLAANPTLDPLNDAPGATLLEASLPPGFTHDQLAERQWWDTTHSHAFPWAGANTYPVTNANDMTVLSQGASKAPLVGLMGYNGPGADDYIYLLDPTTGVGVTGCRIGLLGYSAISCAFDASNALLVVLYGRVAAGGWVQAFSLDDLLTTPYGTPIPTTYSVEIPTGVWGLNSGQRSRVAVSQGVAYGICGGTVVGTSVCVQKVDLASGVIVTGDCGATAGLRTDGAIVLDGTHLFTTFSHPSVAATASEIVIANMSDLTNVAVHALPVDSGTTAYRCQGLVRVGEWLFYSQNCGTTADAKIGVAHQATLGAIDWTTASWHDTELTLGPQIHDRGKGLPIETDGLSLWAVFTKTGVLRAAMYPLAAVTLANADDSMTLPVDPVLRHSSALTDNIGRMCFDGFRMWVIPEHQGTSFCAVPFAVFGR